MLKSIIKKTFTGDPYYLAALLLVLLKAPEFTNIRGAGDPGYWHQTSGSPSTVYNWLVFSFSTFPQNVLSYKACGKYR